MNSFVWTKPLIQENHLLVTAVIIVPFLHQQADCYYIMLEPKTFPSLCCLHSNFQALGRKCQLRSRMVSLYFVAIVCDIFIHQVLPFILGEELSELSITCTVLAATLASSSQEGILYLKMLFNNPWLLALTLPISVIHQFKLVFNYVFLEVSICHHLSSVIQPSAYYLCIVLKKYFLHYLRLYYNFIIISFTSPQSFVYIHLFSTSRS